MEAAVFAPFHNKHGRHDATGAFIPEARDFCKLHGIKRGFYYVNNHEEPMEMRQHVYGVLDSFQMNSMEALVMFCHGWRSGIQFGIGNEHLYAISLRIKRAAVTNGLKIVLYACDTARDMDADREDDRNDFVGGDGGFADRLRDVMNAAGCPTTVYAHSTEGHTTRNPYFRVFLPDETNGGKFIVAPKSALWQKWCRQMRDTDLRFRVPFMTQDQVREELEKL